MARQKCLSDVRLGQYSNFIYRYMWQYVYLIQILIDAFYEPTENKWICPILKVPPSINDIEICWKSFQNFTATRNFAQLE